MTNAELIKALQCASHFALYQDCYEKNCYANSGKGLYCNIPKLMADALGRMESGLVYCDAVENGIERGDRTVWLISNRTEQKSKKCRRC